MWILCVRRISIFAGILSYGLQVESFTQMIPSGHHVRRQTALNAKALTNGFVRAMIASLVVSTATLGSQAAADDIGLETEAPTLFTGETVLICTKRGPLGACLETTERTPENDNDKSNAYFKDPADMVKQRREAEMLAKESEGNALIQKLRQQSSDNKEQNEMIVRQKTLINDQSASFGPFDRQVVILNTDGKTFTLLENPQAMRLKKAGFIEDRRFVKQPTEAELSEALEAPDGEGLGAFMKGIFGSDSG